MEKYVLDTNLFFNMEAGLNLGKTTIEVMHTLSTLIKELKQQKKAEFFMPPRIVDEFMGFFEERDQATAKDFLSLIVVKSPDLSTINFPSSIFYSLVDDIRKRSYRGLNIAEEEIEKAAQEMMGKEELSRKDFQIKVGSYIKKLRERYRQATRFGFLDSVADLDLITLAREQNASIVSTDEGVMVWARLFGAKEVVPAVFLRHLHALVPNLQK